MHVIMEHVNLDVLLKVSLFALVLMSTYFLVQIANTKVHPNQRIAINLTKIRDAALILLGIILVVWLFSKYEILPGILITFIVSVIIAYIINPAMVKLEEKIHNRTLAILLVYVLVVLVFVLIFVMIIPGTMREFRNFVAQLPRMMSNFTGFLDEIQRQSVGKDTFLSNLIPELIGSLKTNLLNLQNLVFSSMGQVMASVSTIVSGILRLILVPIISFYLLKDKEIIIDKIVSAVKPEKRESFLDISREIDASMASFIRGKLIMAFFVGVLTAVALLLFRVDFAIVIGIITGVADIIPYIGPFLGFLPAILMALFDNPIKALWVGIVFGLIQWAENNLLGPRILGTTTGMHPIVVLLSLIVGGGMFGVPGMILSVPVVAIIKILITRLYPLWKGAWDQKRSINK